jgi:transcriptional regulator with XRE-family HTH domain
MRIEKRLGQRLRDMREKRGMTQEGTAERAGVGYKFYQRIEGKSPPSIAIGTLEKLARALSIEPWKLLKFSGKTRKKR